MTTARNPQVTDELLSAYLDDAVTDDERHLVETEAAADADVAWRLESLRATVQLLRELPALALPRNFVLTPEQVGQVAPLPATTSNPLAAPPRGHERTPQPSPGFWAQLATGWQHFWQAGSPALRNAMAASFAALLVLLAAPRIVAPFNGAQIAHNGAPAAEMAPVALDQVPLPAAPPAPPEGAVDGAAVAAPAEGGATEAAADVVVEAPAETAAVAREAASDTTGTVITLAPAAVQGAAAAQPAMGMPPATDEAENVELLAAATSPEVVVAEVSRDQLSARDATTFTVDPFAAQGDDVQGAAAAALAADVPADMPPDALPAMVAAAPAGGATTGDRPAQEPSTAAAPAPKAVATTAENQPETMAGAAELREAAPVVATATPAPTAPPPTATPARVAAAGNGDTAALSEKARVISPPSPPAQEAQGIRLWPLLQVAAALGAVTFGLLWWRSRRK